MGTDGNKIRRTNGSYDCHTGHKSVPDIRKHMGYKKARIIRNVAYVPFYADYPAYCLLLLCLPLCVK